MPNHIRVIGLIVSLFLLVWCIVLLFPGATFAVASYSALAKLAGEYVWGSIAGILGLIQLYHVKRNCPKRMRTSLLFSGGFFIFVAVLLVIANPLTTGYVYFILSGFSFWSYWEVGKYGC